MKKYIYIFMFLAFSAHSQEVTSPSLLSSAGASLEGWGLTSLKMDLSIGEIFINTYSSDDFLLTQGFHQDNIHISSLSENFNLELSVFPNPTNSILNLSLKILACSQFKPGLLMFQVNNGLYRARFMIKQILYL